MRCGASAVGRNPHRPASVQLSFQAPSSVSKTACPTFCLRSPASSLPYNRPMRWLAIDHGTKRIGLAFCDELEILASPFEVWPQEGGRSLDRLARLCKDEGAQALVVGL